MPFVALVAFIFLLGVTGRKPTRGTYLVIAVAAVVASAWDYFG